MIYWSTRKKGLVFYFEDQPKIWLTKEGWQSNNASPELIKECKLLLLEVFYFWLKRFSYSLVKDKVAAILAPQFKRIKESSNMAEKLNLAAWICSEGKNAVRKIYLYSINRNRLRLINWLEMTHNRVLWLVY